MNLGLELTSIVTRHTTRTMNQLPLYALALFIVFASSCKGASAARACSKAGKASRHAPVPPPAVRGAIGGAGVSAGDDLLRQAGGLTDDLAKGAGKADDLVGAGKHNNDLVKEAATNTAEIGLELGLEEEEYEEYVEGGVEGGVE